MKKLIYLIFLLIFNLNHYSQDIAEGKILYIEDKKEIPVQGATIKWLKTDIGTISDEKGLFKLENSSNKEFIEISFLGFKTDTVLVQKDKIITHFLTPSDENNLNEVTVSKRRNSTQRTYLMPQNIIKISEDELLKAACCNLSESFETNPSVDVNHNDAITGTKQIEMLGLKAHTF